MFWQLTTPQAFSHQVPTPLERHFIPSTHLPSSTRFCCKTLTRLVFNYLPRTLKHPPLPLCMYLSLFLFCSPVISPFTFPILCYPLRYPQALGRYSLSLSIINKWCERQVDLTPSPLPVFHLRLTLSTTHVITLIRPINSHSCFSQPQSIQRTAPHPPAPPK